MSRIRTRAPFLIAGLCCAALRLTAQIQISPSSLPDGIIGVPYSTSLTASGGAAPYTWSLVSGTLPLGMTLNAASGLLAGSPAAAGPFSFRVRATDATSRTQELTYTLAIQGLPKITFSGATPSAESRQQIDLGLSLSQTFPQQLNGALSLTFEPDAVNPADDPTVVFSTTASRTTSFSVRAGQLTAAFPGASAASFQTGTTAGVIHLRITSLNSASVDLTSSAPSLDIRVARSIPVVPTIRLEPTAAGFRAVVVAYSNTREISAVAFRFAAASGATVTTSSLSIAGSSDLFNEWFRGAQGLSVGGQFQLTVEFTVQGDINAIASAAITVANSAGNSAEGIATLSH